MSRNLLETAGFPVEVDLKSTGDVLSLAGKLGPRKIRTKILILFVVLLMAVSAFFLWYFPVRLGRHLTKDIVATTSTITSATAMGIAHDLAIRDAASLERTLQAIREQSKEVITYAVLEDAEGSIVAAVNRNEAMRSRYHEQDPIDPSKNPLRFYRTKTLIVSGEATLGNLYLGFSFRDLMAEMTRERAIIAAACLALLLVSGLFVLLIGNVITRPLTHVTRTAERIVKGDLKQRARIYSRDEAGLLARTFNAMLDGLEASYRKIESLNRSLEEKIAGRSVELEKEIAERRRVEKELRLAKGELEHRVEKRTEELSKVNDELHGRVLETRRAEDQLQFTLDRLEKALEGTVRAMSLTIEMRDLYTAGHQRRVSSLAVAIGEEMHLPVDKLEGLRMAGIIHDIGKIAMPAEILTKPTRLTRTEFQLIKDHPRVGFDILKSIEFPWPVAHIILQHHERMDGSGYPDGLLGDAILVEARILAVADVVEALSSHRPYRPALGQEKALEEIRRGRGIRYDMRVVDACIKLFREGKFSFKTEDTARIFQ
jgi:putative nucleotidyltransferase with HDIG domain